MQIRALPSISSMIAHLTRHALLRELEERATVSRWVLSAYTISDEKGAFRALSN